MALYRQGRDPGLGLHRPRPGGGGAAAGLALGPDDVVAPLNRELACHLARGVTVADAFRNYLGRGDGPTRPRRQHALRRARSAASSRSSRCSATSCPVIVGAALAFKRRRQPRVALTFFGDGAFTVGDTHEGLNLAGVLQVPAVFVLQSNRYAYSTPDETADGEHEPGRADRGRLVDPRARASTAPMRSPCYDAVRAAVERARAGGGPQAVEALTLRIARPRRARRRRYVPAELRGCHADPIERLEADPPAR